MNRRQAQPPERTGPAVDPRLPNRPLLIASSVALAVWISFLILVALRVI